MRGPFRVTWLDAYVPEDQWYTKESFELESRPMETVGWILYQGSDYMVIAGTYDELGEAYTQVIAVPRGCIVEIKDVSSVVELSDSGSGSGGGSGLPAPSGDVA